MWAVITLGIGSYYGYKIGFSEDKTELLIGESTYGHYQIEMACETCHTDPFGGGEVLQNACLQCHAEELESVNDSHPKSKFTDPRNADLLEIIDARYCVSCHTEHHKDKTLEMGLTLPADYCFHCHEEIGEERESHQGMAFDSCASAGCHNYHDNLALYEGFLVRHANEPIFKAIVELPDKTGKKNYFEKNPDVIAMTPQDINVTALQGELNQKVVDDWAHSSHAMAGVGCVDCHQEGDSSKEWIAKPSHQQCQSCHTREVKGFLEGKHGMRLADTLSQPLKAITPAESELMFKEESLGISHSCTTCHGAHTFDVKKAAVEACLGCHSDEHSLAFLDSPHGKLWEKEHAGELPENSGVSCASCHMHREVTGKDGSDVFVVHNQNLTLRPNEKMIRPVCMNCHGLAFAIDALADEKLIRNNFNGQPSVHIESIDMAIERDK